MKTNLKSLFSTASIFAALALVISGCGGGQTEDTGAADGRDEASATPASGGQFALTTEIPPAKIEGTPMPIKVPNLEQAPRAAPSVPVPEGTVLVSRGKTVTGSDDFPIIGDLAMITDGEKLGGEGYFVEFIGGLPQWVQIDLEESIPVEAVWIWHFHSQARAYHDVIVQLSDDPTFESGVTTVFNNDYDDSAGLGVGKAKPYVESNFGKLIDVDSVPARYVRLYATGNTSSDSIHYIEVEVFGRSL